MNWKWFFIIGAGMIFTYFFYNYVKKNGIIDIFAGLFILASIIFFGGLLFAIMQEGAQK